ncbi:Uncharacterised protein [Vibrio cholerae]|nr:Uncharacterised protein [Vibrio cholerae]
MIAAARAVARRRLKSGFLDRRCDRKLKTE